MGKNGCQNVDQFSSSASGSSNSALLYLSPIKENVHESNNQTNGSKSVPTSSWYPELQSLVNIQEREAEVLHVQLRAEEEWGGGDEWDEKETEVEWGESKEV